MGFAVDSVHVGISDPSISVHLNSAMIPVNRVATAQDVQRVLRAAEAIPLQPHEEIMHVLPLAYYVDKKLTEDPEGHRCVRLDVDAKIVTIPKSAVEAVQQVCQAVGLTPREIIFTPLATARAVTNPRSTFLGTVVIDIGAGTTDVTVHEGNKLIYFDVIPVGGDYITSDLAQGLHCLSQEAEAIKREHGCASPVYLGDEELPITALAQKGFTRWEVTYQDVATIIGARIDEILTMIMARMEQAGVQLKDRFEVILTGGSADLAHMKTYIQEVFGLQTIIGIPNIPAGVFDLAKRPEFAAGVGLLMYATPFSYEEELSSAPVEAAPQKPNVFVKITSWVGGFFD